MWEHALEYLELAWKIIFALAVLGWAAFMLKMRGTFVTKAQFAHWLRNHEETHGKIDARFARGEQQFAGIEATLKTLATSEQVAKIRVDMTKVEGELKTMEGTLDGKINALDQKLIGSMAVNNSTANLVSAIHDHLLNGKG